MVRVQWSKVFAWKRQAFSVPPADNDLMNIASLLWFVVRALLAGAGPVAIENLALRQQLAIYHYNLPRPKLRCRDRIFWLMLARLWSGWKSALVVVSPATVVRWHRLGFRYYWRWKSRGQPGRKPINAEARILIRRISQENPTWGTPRIQAELHLLGHDIAKASIDKYRIRNSKPPSPSWRAFLKNHVASLASMDFFVVPTVTYSLLYVLVILRHDRRRIAHFAVTQHPTSAWVAQHVREAFPYDSAPRYLIRDRDGVYGDEVRRCLASMHIEEVVIAPRSPWQNPFAERVIGTLRRECLDHVIVLSEAHLRRILKSYVSYYHNCRPHRSLGQNSPEPRDVEPPGRGKVISIPKVGGLHHEYRRVA